MKNIFKNFGLSTLLVFLLVSCDNENIDPITRVAPGEDAASPVVNISYPSGDIVIPFTDTQTNLDVDFTVSDDIEIAKVSVLVDGKTPVEFKDFIDYRRFVKKLSVGVLQLGNHSVTIAATDINGKLTTKTMSFKVDNTYSAIMSGEKFYMPFFDGSYIELISETNASVVGLPSTTSAGYFGFAYAGAVGSYLTFPTSNLGLGNEFSATFWYNVKTGVFAGDDRAGILVAGPPDLANPNAMNNRKNGFRLFRENASGKQRIKLNVGNGTADTWVDGGAAADIETNNGKWRFIAFSIASNKASVYIDGVLVKEAALSAPIDWTGCDILSIMSGEPRFAGWNHKADGGLMDELRTYNRALSKAEILTVMNRSN